MHGESELLELDMDQADERKTLRVVNRCLSLQRRVQGIEIPFRQ